MTVIITGKINGDIKASITKTLEAGPQPLHTIVARILEDGRIYDTNDIMNALYELSAEQTIERDDETGIIYRLK
jgi:hypothetical protein